MFELDDNLFEVAKSIITYDDILPISWLDVHDRARIIQSIYQFAVLTSAFEDDSDISENNLVQLRKKSFDAWAISLGAMHLHKKDLGKKFFSDPIDEKIITSAIIQFAFRFGTYIQPFVTFARNTIFDRACAGSEGKDPLSPQREEITDEFILRANNILEANVPIKAEDVVAALEAEIPVGKLGTVPQEIKAAFDHVLK